MSNSMIPEKKDEILVVNGYEDYDFAESGWM